MSHINVNASFLQRDCINLTKKIEAEIKQLKIKKDTAAGRFNRMLGRIYKALENNRKNSWRKWVFAAYDRETIIDRMPGPIYNRCVWKNRNLLLFRTYNEVIEKKKALLPKIDEIKRMAAKVIGEQKGLTSSTVALDKEDFLFIDNLMKDYIC